MAVSNWLVVIGICLLYVALGRWAVSQIFPMAQAAQQKRTSASSNTKKESVRT